MAYVSLESAEVLRSLRHYLLGQSQGRNTNDLEAKRVERRKRSTIFPDRTEKGRSQSDQHSNSCKDIIIIIKYISNALNPSLNPSYVCETQRANMH